MGLKRRLQFFGLFTVLLTLIPLVAKQYWWIKIFDFPHFQLTVLTLVSLAAFFIRFDVKSKFDLLFVGVLLSCFVYQLVKIYPYTVLARHEVLPATSLKDNRMLGLYTANVYQDNKDSKKLLEEIKKYDSDILVLTETNSSWVNVMEENTGSKYGYRVVVPLENTYGMLLFSKFPLYDTHVKYIVDDSIPSIHTKLLLPSKDTVQLFAIHPTPPLPQHNPKSTDRDAELMEIAQLSRSSKFSVIVTGDFNDVAWSGTTSLFQRTSGLLDMRKGRGFYNTYHAQYPIFRWPLDHIFTSGEFRHVTLESGNNIDSDHFPIYTKLSFEPGGKDEQKIPPPTKEELERANSYIRKGELAN